MRTINWSIAIWVGMFLSSVSLAEPCNECDHTDSQFSCVEFVRNYDGDTVTVNIKDVHPLFGSKISIRVDGIDTAEIRGKTDCERASAIKARDLVASILKNAKVINLVDVGRGKYFRVTAQVVVDGLDLGEFLIEKKLAYRYSGGTKPDYDWCD